NVSRLHIAAWDCFLDAGDDHIAQAGSPPLGAAEYLDAHAFLGAGVVGHVKIRIHLNHGTPTIPIAHHRAPGGSVSCLRQTTNVLQLYTAGGASSLGAAACAGAFFTTRTRRHRFSFDIGLASIISTVSPARDSFCSSWA